MVLFYFLEKAHYNEFNLTLDTENYIYNNQNLDSTNHPKFVLTRTNIYDLEFVLLSDVK
jgi:hypothetical protein